MSNAYDRIMNANAQFNSGIERAARFHEEKSAKELDKARAAKAAACHDNAELCTAAAQLHNTFACQLRELKLVTQMPFGGTQLPVPHCGNCDVELDQPNEPLTKNCGGDCWRCVGEAEYGAMAYTERSQFDALRYPYSMWQEEVANSATSSGYINWRDNKVADK